jgi:hypothetical protein
LSAVDAGTFDRDEQARVSSSMARLQRALHGDPPPNTPPLSDIPPVAATAPRAHPGALGGLAKVEATLHVLRTQAARDAEAIRALETELSLVMVELERRDATVTTSAARHARERAAWEAEHAHVVAGIQRELDAARQQRAAALEHAQATESDLVRQHGALALLQQRCLAAETRTADADAALAVANEQRQQLQAALASHAQEARRFCLFFVGFFCGCCCGFFC